MIGDDNIGSHGYSKEEIDEQTYYRSVASDCGKSITTVEASNYGNVNRIEQLLQNAAGGKRHGENDDLRKQRAVKHVYLVLPWHLSYELIVFNEVFYPTKAINVASSSVRFSPVCIFPLGQ